MEAKHEYETYAEHCLRFRDIDDVTALDDSGGGQFPDNDDNILDDFGEDITGVESVFGNSEAEIKSPASPDVSLVSISCILFMGQI